eukprot:CAMPEP_0178916038 /NCGR_PEP_ID=MMETSP0786-20121207/12392_1 /TAXON_ID=186022 /ORGANISM="Thalassionema frauenfeldii, Strain CCMP 1798" /LENGTH=286 /DNA_ID=CAMNT_0020589279 /DNA_START=118 /DNA_END=978 /DNA_ORIENTATION=+
MQSFSTKLFLIAFLCAKSGYAFTTSSIITQPKRLSNNNEKTTSLYSSIVGNNIGTGLSSGLISSLAEVALKLRLQHQQSVNCIVNMSSQQNLFRGKVGPVTVKGRGWGSRLGLTCRAIEATVDQCDLDVGRVLRDQKLRLETPALGQAMVALDPVDFGNFITHPLMKNQQNVAFSKDDVVMDAQAGTVTFYGTFQKQQWKFILSRHPTKERALIRVVSNEKNAAVDDSLTANLSQIMSDFFNEMVFELDGTFLTFRDMQLTPTKNGLLMLKLAIKVRKFPSPGLDF